MAKQRNAQGVTISFAALTFDALITGFTLDGIEVPVLDGSHLGSVAWREQIFGELKTPGSVSFDIWGDPDDLQDLMDDMGTEDTLTIQFPPIDAQAAGAKIDGLGAITGGPGLTGATDELMAGSFVFTYKAEFTVTPGA